VLSVFVRFSCAASGADARRIRPRALRGCRLNDRYVRDSAASDELFGPACRSRVLKVEA
jgi:hypothetical protein